MRHATDETAGASPKPLRVHVRAAGERSVRAGGVRAKLVALALLLLTALLRAPGTEAQEYAAEPQAASSPKEWSFLVIPYLWLPEMSGTLSADGRTAAVDVTFADVFDLLGDGDLLAGMGHFEAKHRSGFSLFVDAIGGTARPSHQAAIVPPSNLRLDAKLELNFAYIEFGYAYTILERVLGADGDPVVQAADLDSNRVAHFDVLVGGRVNYFFNSIDIQGSRGNASRSTESTSSWTDPFVGCRWSTPLIGDLSLDFRGDIGGFTAGSKLAWNLIAGFEYVLPWRPGNARTSVIAAYKVYDFDYEDGSGPDATRIDLNQRGPGIGLAFEF